MNIQERYKPFLLILFAVVFTFIFSSIPVDFDLGFYKVKEMDLLIDVKPDSLISAKTHPVSPVFASLFTVGRPVNNYNNNGSFSQPSVPVQSKVPITGNTEQMKYFYEALKSSKSRKVRIAHFGDSVIEGDLISADLRKNIQSKYGGNGVGMLAINAQDIAFRVTTEHSFSPKWTFGSLFGTNPDKLKLGINGTAAKAGEASWVKYVATGRYGVKNFSSARIFYTSDKSVNVNYSFNDEGAKSVSLKPASEVQENVLTYPNRAKSLKLDIPASAGTVYFGVSLEDGNGVYIDNFPLRGNSGTGMRDMDEALLKQFNKILDYKLIVLQFGLNMVSAGGEARDFSWYETAMVKVVNTLKANFPNTSILLIGVQDKGLKKGSKFVTDPKVLKLIEAQKGIAEQTGIAFWNLFEAMGGQESMSQWVADGLAAKDYTHLNTEGARKVAELISDALLSSAK
ncbi:MAG: hypothetical protein HUU54_02100 [Ignavibacteriaceae bacterium]|nr:hypothetical protein [Ignavibacteriaceae bacterium]